METLRKIRWWLDGLFIWFFGRRVLIENVIIKENKNALYHEDQEKEWESPVELYGLYAHPDINEYRFFGVDSPDEMALELNYSDTIKKLGHSTTIGSKITILDMNRRDAWIIVHRNIEDHRIWGSGRLVLALQKYVPRATTEHVNSVEAQSN